MFELKHVDYIELYVGNPFQAAHFYRTLLGFAPVAYAGPETDVCDIASYYMVQGNIRLVLTGPLSADGPIAEHVRRHGDSVRDIAFEVVDAVAMFEHAVGAGGRPVHEPTVTEDQHGRVVKAAIAAYGDTIHSFVQRDAYGGLFLPGYTPIMKRLPVSPIGLQEIDHVAVSVESGQMEQWAAFYTQVLRFHELHDEVVSTEHSAMNSKVVADSAQRIKFPLLEPRGSTAHHQSQINEYLRSHDGPGAQHLAFLCDNIMTTLNALTANGIEFLSTPDAYYDALEERIGPMDAGWLAEVRRHGILVDRDEHGMLLQIFSRPIQSRPTLFLELIQRNGARGFGSGNIKALFEAVECEQSRRNKR